MAKKRFFTNSFYDPTVILFPLKMPACQRLSTHNYSKPMITAGSMSMLGRHDLGRYLCLWDLTWKQSLVSVLTTNYKIKLQSILRKLHEVRKAAVVHSNFHLELGRNRYFSSSAQFILRPNSSSMVRHFTPSTGCLSRGSEPYVPAVEGWVTELQISCSIGKQTASNCWTNDSCPSLLPEVKEFPFLMMDHL